MNEIRPEIAGSRILIVDDEESIRFTFTNFLVEEGYEAVSAENFGQAVEVLRREEIDLAFVDIVLGGKSGLDLLSEIKKASPETEVIVITGAPTVVTASTALRLGALDYIVKPVRQDTLLRVAGKALEHKRLKAAKEAYRLNLEAIFNSVQDAIITADKDLIVAEVNSAVGDLCCIRRDTARGAPVRSTIYQCSGACLEALEMTVATGETVRREHIDCESKKKPNQVVSVAATPLLRQDGTPIGGVMVIRDETPRLELEKTLAETRRFSKLVGQSPAISETAHCITVRHCPSLRSGSSFLSTCTSSSNSPWPSLLKCTICSTEEFRSIEGDSKGSRSRNDRCFRQTSTQTRLIWAAGSYDRILFSRAITDFVKRSSSASKIARKISSRVEKYRYTLGLLMPAARAIPFRLISSYVSSEKSFRAASRIG